MTIADDRAIGVDDIEKRTIGKRLIDILISNQNRSNRGQLEFLKKGERQYNDTIILLSKELESIQDKVIELSVSQKKYCR